MLEVFEISEGQWGYRGIGIFQEYHPDKDGFVPMNKEEAQKQADIMESRLSN